MSSTVSDYHRQALSIGRWNKAISHGNTISLVLPGRDRAGPLFPGWIWPRSSKVAPVFDEIYRSRVRPRFNRVGDIGRAAGGPMKGKEGGKGPARKRTRRGGRGRRGPTAVPHCHGRRTKAPCPPFHYAQIAPRKILSARGTLARSLVYVATYSRDQNYKQFFFSPGIARFGIIYLSACFL